MSDPMDVFFQDEDASAPESPPPNTQIPASGDDSAGGQRQFNDFDVFTHWLRPTGQLLLLAVKHNLDIAKFQVVVGHKPDGEGKMSMLPAFVDAIEFSSWLDTMRYGTAKALSGSDDGLKFASYGGGKSGDMLVSRQIFIEPLTDKKGTFRVTVRHSEGAQNSQGAIMPKSDGQAIGTQSINLNGRSLAELGLRCNLALTRYASVSEANLRTLYGERSQS